ncbi:MAG: 6-phosphogluconolactonase [bacterium]
MTKPEIIVFNTPDELAQAAAEQFATAAEEAIANHGRFRVALSGGNTPKQVYSLLGSGIFDERVRWSQVDLFFGDERCVLPEDPQSNYRMVRETLVSQVPIPQKNVHRIQGELTPAKAAALYDSELKKIFAGSSWPRFDLVFLGLGEDGHTASLFPSSLPIDENAWVAASWVKQLNSFRITLTAPALNAAAKIIFLVTGLNKAKTLVEVLNGPFDPQRLPAQRMQPTDGAFIWMVDAAAASTLKS